MLAKAMASVPAKGGLATATITLKGAEVEVSQRIRSNITAGAYAGRTWAGKLEAGTRVKVSW